MSKREWEQRAQAVTVVLVAAKDELGRLGLLKTMHRLDEATRAIGYERAEGFPVYGYVRGK